MRIRALCYIFLFLLTFTGLSGAQTASAASTRNCNTSTSTPEIICSKIPEIKIETVYPAHMIVNQSYVITVSLVPKTGSSANLNNLKDLENATMVVTKPTLVGTPDTTVRQAFGPGFEPVAIATLNAGTLKVLSTPSSDEQTLRQPVVEWDWNVTPQYTGTQILSIDLEFIWKPIQSGSSSILPQPIFRIGNPQLSAQVTEPPAHPVTPPPFITLGQITLSDLITQMFIGILIFSTLALLFFCVLELIQERMKR